jgi:hypothetical protein
MQVFLATVLVSQFSEQKASTVVAGGDVLTVTVGTAVAGALGYNIYVGTVTGAQT